METLVTKWILPNWERKLVAFISAMIIWIYISQSIHSKKTVTTHIPVEIQAPTGTLPEGYELLGIWPHVLEHKVTGSAKEVDILRQQGLNLSFNLNQITKVELDQLKAIPGNPNSDEITFFVPDEWKKVFIPFQDKGYETINDPDTRLLQMTVLKKEFIPIKQPLPIRVFYPVNTFDTFNKETLPLLPNPLLKVRKEKRFITQPLFAYRVSRLFINTVQNNMEIVVIPKQENDGLSWSINFIDPKSLEERYIQAFKEAGSLSPTEGPRMEWIHRERFRDYMYNLQLYQSPGKPFNLSGTITKDKGIFLKEK